MSDSPEGIRNESTDFARYRFRSLDAVKRAAREDMKYF